MLQKIFFMSLIIASGLSEDFITDFEYGQMLYQDPHGASCIACHGETGGGVMIGEYTDQQGHVITLSGPDIRHATLEQIRNSIHQGRGIMPRYFLTEKEIRTIYAYLKQVNTPKTSSISGLFTKPADRNLTQKRVKGTSKSAE